MAASHDEEEICRMLIEEGANLRCCDEDEATPLHYACAEGSIAITQMLFEAGEKQDGWVTVSQVGGAYCSNCPVLYLAGCQSFMGLKCSATRKN